MTRRRRPDPRTAVTKARLLGAATEELLIRNGGLELQSVAAASGVVPSVVGHHFGSRAGLVCAVVDDFFDRLHAEVLDLDLRALGGWHAREHERVRRGVRFYLTEPLTPVIYGSLTRDDEIGAVETAHVQKVVAASARNIAAAQRSGELPRGIDPMLAAATIFGALRQITITAMTSARRPSEQAVVEQLWRVTVAAVDPKIREEST